MEKEKFYIDILNNHKDKFQNHINIDNNYRTIFSGIFGVGKTTFLKDFFALEEMQNYEVIHLFPVNYSIASNEDIFELIKFDILYRLLEKNIDIDIENVNIDITAFQFIVENFNEIIFPFLNFIPEVGGSIKEIATKCIELKKKFEVRNKDCQRNELQEIDAFLNEFSKRKGTIYESDFYTELIVSLVSKFEKKTVLIIDDLDRIDPDHIFRLLNIFSAHTDIKGDESNYNKFDFDKIIFVCDVNNIRNIYKAKFGIETDFNGYIDKFYSCCIYQFKIDEILNKYTDKIISNFKFSNEHHSAAALDYNNSFSEHFIFIIKHLFINNKISLRDIVRVSSLNIDMSIYTLEKIGYSKYSNTKYVITQIYDIFYEIFGNDKNKLLGAFNNIDSFIYSNNDDMRYYLEDVVLLTYLINNDFLKDIKSNSEVKSNLGAIEYKITSTNDRFTIMPICTILNFNDIKNDFNYFKLLYNLFDILSKRI